MKKILLCLVLVLFYSFVFAGESLWVKSDALDGYPQYENGSYDTSINTSLEIGHEGAGGNYIWKRGIITFDLTGKSKVSDATLNLFYKDDVIQLETCDFDLYSIADVGAAIDEPDWDSTVHEKVKDNWFDETLDTNISTSVKDAWNNAIDAGRTTLSFRIVMDNEATYTSAIFDCWIELCDTNQVSEACTGGVLYNPYVDYTPVIPTPILASEAISLIQIISVALPAALIFFLFLFIWVVKPSWEYITVEVISGILMIFIVIVIIAGLWIALTAAR